jgi:putative DNA methylase
MAETLSKARATSIDRMVALGMVEARRGAVRLLRPEEVYRAGRSAERSDHHALRTAHATLRALNPWLAVHCLTHALMTDGETAAADLVAHMARDADLARDLAYRLYTICERKKRAQEALAYNALVQSWGEIARLAQERRASLPAQQPLFD